MQPSNPRPSFETPRCAWLLRVRPEIPSLPDSRASTILRADLRQNNPTGQITSDFQKSCQALPRKIFRFTPGANQRFSRAVSPDERGGSRSSSNARWDAVDADVRADERRTTRTAKSCGPDAPTLASSSREASSARRRWQESPVTEESAIVSRKPLRREGRIASAEPVCSCAFSCCHLRTRPRVQRAPGLPCALFLARGVKVTQSPGAICVAAMRSRVRDRCLTFESEIQPRCRPGQAKRDPGPIPRCAHD